jgi:branched-chain amino acid transport system substrate-binding protein
MKANRWTLRVGIAAVFGCLSVGALVAAATSSARPGATAATAGQVKIGMVMSLSGALGAYGVPVAYGVKIAIAQVNDSGTFKVKGKAYDFSLATQDDRSDPQTAVGAATQLISDDNAKFIMGPLGNLAPHVDSVSQADGAIVMNPASATVPLAGTKANPLVFSLTVPNLVKADGIVQSIKKFAPHAKRIAIVGNNDADAQTIGVTLSQALKAAKYTTQTFLYPIGTTDVGPVMTQVAAFKPDFIVTGFDEADAELIAGAVDGAGIAKSVPMSIYGTPYAAAKQSVAPKTPGRPLLAVPYVEADFSIPKPNAAEKVFIKKYLQYTHETTLDPAAAASELNYDGVPLLAAAMEKAGTVTNTAAIARALLTVSAQGLAGVVKFNKQADLVEGLDFTYIPSTGAPTTFHYPK